MPSELSPGEPVGDRPITEAISSSDKRQQRERGVWELGKTASGCWATPFVERVLDSSPGLGTVGLPGVVWSVRQPREERAVPDMH